MKNNPNRFFFLMMLIFSMTTFAGDKTRYVLKNKSDGQILTEQLTELIPKPEMKDLNVDKIKTLYEIEDTATAQAVLELVQRFSTKSKVITITHTSSQITHFSLTPMSARAFSYSFFTDNDTEEDKKVVIDLLGSITALNQVSASNSAKILLAPEINIFDQATYHLNLHENVSIFIASLFGKLIYLPFGSLDIQGHLVNFPIFTLTQLHANTENIHKLTLTQAEFTTPPLGAASPSPDLLRLYLQINDQGDILDITTSDGTPISFEELPATDTTASSSETNTPGFDPDALNAVLRAGTNFGTPIDTTATKN